MAAGGVNGGSHNRCQTPKTATSAPTPKLSLRPKRPKAADSGNLKSGFGRLYVGCLECRPWRNSVNWPRHRRAERLLHKADTSERKSDDRCRRGRAGPKWTMNGGRNRHPPFVSQLQIDALRDRQCVIHLDAEIAHRALQLGMAERARAIKLHFLRH
jgi:hypothetical protein